MFGRGGRVWRRARAPAISPRVRRSSSGASATVFVPVGAEQLFFRWLVFANRGHEMGNVDEVLVVEVFADAVATPGPAPHAEREVEPVVEGAAVAEHVGLVDEHAHHVNLFGELARAGGLLRVQPAGVSATLMPAEST